MAVLHLKITLKGSKPAITRDVLVEDKDTFEDLHDIIQVVMPWDGDHAWSFEKGRDISFIMSAEFKMDKTDKLASGVKLSSFFKLAKTKIDYTYDFGDNWEHEVLLVKILEPKAGNVYPVCIKGQNACPPEDCGGLWGYYDMLETIKNPKHDDYEEMRDWLGLEGTDVYDPTAFDIEDVNDDLGGIFIA